MEKQVSENDHCYYEYFHTIVVQLLRLVLFVVSLLLNLPRFVSFPDVRRNIVQLSEPHSIRKDKNNVALGHVTAEPRKIGN